MCGHSEIVKLLLQDSRVNPGTCSNYALRVASELGHLEVVKILLLDSRVNPTAYANAAIKVASERGHSEIVKLLIPRTDLSHITSGKILNLAKEISNENMEKFKLAIRNGDLDMVKILLLDNQFDPSYDSNHAIRVASKQGHMEIVKILLLDPRVNPTDSDNSAIRLASQNNHPGIVKLLIPKTDLSKITDEKILNIAKEMATEENKALFNKFRVAISENNIDMVKSLLPNLDPSFNSNSAIRLAIRSGNLEIVKVLMQDTRFNPTVGTDCLIMLASSEGHLEIVKILLLDFRFDPSYYDNNAIKSASAHKHWDIVKILALDPRVDPSAGDNCVIKFAVENSRLDIVKELICRVDVTQITDEKTIGPINEILEADLKEKISKIRILMKMRKISKLKIEEEKCYLKFKF